jgi:hypothetical protein
MGIQHAHAIERALLAGGPVERWFATRRRFAPNAVAYAWAMSRWSTSRASSSPPAAIAAAPGARDQCTGV